MTEYSVYVLKSLKNNKRYVGSTHKNPTERLRDHNSGSNVFTRENKPWILLYYETGYCKTCSLKREHFLKSGQGRRILDAIEKNDKHLGV